MGGAADYQRKQARAVFIGGLLKEYGFCVEVKGVPCLPDWKAWKKKS